MINIQYRLRNLREDADLTQEQLAKIIHMHKTTYVRYETGEREIPLNIAILLAKYYDVNLDYIAGITNKKGDKHISLNLLLGTYNKQSIPVNNASHHCVACN